MSKRQIKLLTNKIKQLQKDLKLPSLIVGIRINNINKPNKTIIIESENKVSKNKLPENKSSKNKLSKTYTRIGSITKTFVVTLLLQLVDRNKLSLYDTVATFTEKYPKLRKLFARIPNQNATLRDLASMTSGISNYSTDEEFQLLFFSNPYRTWAPGELLKFVSSKPNFPPGTAFEYSNTNTVMIGLIIEEVMNCNISSILDAFILRPLKLKHTLFPDFFSKLKKTKCSQFPCPHWQGYTIQGNDTNETDQDYNNDNGNNKINKIKIEIGNIDIVYLPESNNNKYKDKDSNDYKDVKDYKDNEDNIKIKNATCWNPSFAWAAGAMISNVKDLLKWGQILATGCKILSRKLQTERLTSFRFDLPIFGTNTINTQRAYGLGFGFDRGWIGHEGEIPGFDTLLLYNTKLYITVVIMTNVDFVPSDLDNTDNINNINTSPTKIIFNEIVDYLYYFSFGNSESNNKVKCKNV